MIKLIEITEGKHEEKSERKCKLNFIEQIHNEAISEMSKTGIYVSVFLCVCGWGNNDLA